MKTANDKNSESDLPLSSPFLCYERVEDMSLNRNSQDCLASKVNVTLETLNTVNTVAGTNFPCDGIMRARLIHPTIQIKLDSSWKEIPIITLMVVDGLAITALIISVKF